MILCDIYRRKSEFLAVEKCVRCKIGCCDTKSVQGLNFGKYFQILTLEGLLAPQLAGHSPPRHCNFTQPNSEGGGTWDLTTGFCSNLLPLARSVGLEFRTHLDLRKYIRRLIWLILRTREIRCFLKSNNVNKILYLSHIPPTMTNCSEFCRLSHKISNEVFSLDFSLFCPRSEPLVSH